MRLKAVFVRFYKSFNYDYLRKHRTGAEAAPWETIEGMWYPYVRVPIDNDITTVVGANESGKSHLLSAIEKGITGADIKREDFCRYSQFFTVEQGKMRLPDIGFEWTSLTEKERTILLSSCSLPLDTAVERFLLFRTDGNRLTVYIPAGKQFNAYPLPAAGAQSVSEMLPRVIRINSEVALPQSVPIRWLAGESQLENRSLELLGRGNRFDLFEAVETFVEHAEWFLTAETVTHSAAKIADALGEYATEARSGRSDGHRRRDAEYALARDLVCKVACIDPAALGDLYRALKDGKEGYANGIIQRINDALAASLNFPRWWVQDRNFRLMVSPREYDLVFTIRDRTNTEYSFSERSSGLHHFLSYYIQYRAHEPREDGDELLLMDEPDAFLSSQAQQDLLKVFRSFACPEGDRRPIQVVYVTHSPFLIDKNHAERIRVLEKGVGDEGTRVVRDASRNHYEPLRSAFGAFVAETTFIGNINLMVEGPADQVLIAGAAAYLRKRGASYLETLDLNHVTIVPAGSASHIPYMVFLARGRDIERPAIIVLLDSDGSGNDAKRDLQRGGPKRKQLLKKEFIFQIGDLSGCDDCPPYLKTHTLLEIEDLIPLPICAAAARVYAAEVCGAKESVIKTITADAISQRLTGKKSAIDALGECFREHDLHIDKLGFARLVVGRVNELSASPSSSDSALHAALADFDAGMKALFRQLGGMQRRAERELTEDRVSQRIDRAKASFLHDHPNQARREQAFVLLEDLEAVLDDDSKESDEARRELQSIRRDFQLKDSGNLLVEPYADFRERLERLKYAGRLATQEPDEVNVAMPVEPVVPEAPAPDSSNYTPPVKAEDAATVGEL